VQFPIGAVLQHSNTPSLRVAGFEDEDDDEDENEAPHEWRPKMCVQSLPGVATGPANSGASREAVLGLPSPNCSPPRGVGSAFRADPVYTWNPGLKPWANIYNHFVVRPTAHEKITHVVGRTILKKAGCH
jgi:hypothetical protein